MRFQIWYHDGERKERAVESPFPGMDPYLERPNRWPDVHNQMISEMRRQLERKLNRRYTTVLTEYMAIEQIGEERRFIVPDTAVTLQRPSTYSGDGGVALAVEVDVAIDAPAMTLPGIVSIPTPYMTIEIRTIEGDELVTAIELLSPANKRPGRNGADAYEAKRAVLLDSRAHLLEIDLLRAGTRPQTGRPIPPCDYAVLLNRADRTWRPFEIWTWNLPDRLPVVAAPLLRPDPDVPLDLGAALRNAYANARYDRKITYTEPTPDPALAPETASWLDTLLVATNRRSPAATNPAS